jgi:dTDP-4-dehydrorhamnose reductase
MRVMVTGVGGLVGSNVAAVALQQSWEVLGCSRDGSLNLRGARSAVFDMADRKACVQAALEFEPDVIVHAAGAVSPSRFEREPYLAQVEYVGAEHTLAAAQAVRARYALVSCDCVHSGYRPAGTCFSERDLPDPVNAYGRSKLACEEAAMRSRVPWLITRPGDLYGVNLARPRRFSLSLRLVKRLRDHTSLPAPEGLWRSPTYARDYAQRLCELLAQGCEGVYHMGGPRSLGRMEWLQLLAGGLGCSRDLVREGTAAAYLQACGEDPHLKVPSNVALSQEKATAAIGSCAVAPERGVELVCEQLNRVLKPDLPQAR